jgi:hypothetical protein
LTLLRKERAGLIRHPNKSTVSLTL